MRADIIAGIQAVVAVLLILSVLMQQRGGGTGSVLGGTSVSSGGEYYRARRGFEKFLYYSTITLGTILVVTCFLYFYV